MEKRHVPVLLEQVIAGLKVQPGGRYIDGTLGGGGHAAQILAASSPDGVLLGIDRDPAALQTAKARLAGYAERFELVHSSFALLAYVAAAHGFVPVDGVLLDLGLSSLQLADAERGFSFLAEGPLDMRFDTTSRGRRAADLVNQLSLEDLADILNRYGEERQSRRIARAIVEARPLHTTQELVEVVERAVPRRRGRLHPATLVFQALRIAVNDELTALESVLPQAVDLLVPGGRLVIIAFHSLEDRIVKRFMRRESKDCICPPELPICMCDHQAILNLITRKPIQPTDEEIRINPRSRSARLRVAERKA